MTNTDPTIDVGQINDLIDQYHQTEDRAKRREIENRVLSETVWKELPSEVEAKFCISEDQIERVYEELPDDALEAKRILRLLYMKQL